MNTNNEKVLSIVIPCYNEEGSILKPVKKVLESPIKNKEIIIVEDDNGGICRLKNGNKYRIRFSTNLEEKDPQFGFMLTDVLNNKEYCSINEEKNENHLSMIMLVDNYVE